MANKKEKFSVFSESGQNGFEDWGGYMAAKKAKLAEQFQEEAAKEFENSSTLFQGIFIFVNGYTNPTADELRRLMMEHGGVYHHYMRPRITTHIIASNLPYSKIMMHKKSQNPIPICKPEWISDSIKAGRLLDFQNYLLYSNFTKTQPKLHFGPTEADKAATLEDTTSEDPTTTPHDESKQDSSTAESLCGSSKTIEPVPSTSKATTSSLSTKNPEFLSEFYNNSRLHHISTMGAMFKDYINELRDTSDGKFPGLERLKRLDRTSTRPESFAARKGNEQEEDEEDTLDFQVESTKRNQETVIMHIDMDCFFVSVGLRNRPELRGLPVAVTHAKGNPPKNPQNATSRETELRMYKQRFQEKMDKTRGGGESKETEIRTRVDNLDDNCSMSEIASCSYEARKAGVKNGMFLGQALKLCPDLRTIHYDFEGYKEVSYALYDTVASYSLNIEAVSCDEMYTDLTKVLAESRLTPLQFAEVIRGEIKEKTGCPVSTGFGRNKLQARLATRKAKPDGQFHLKSENVQSYLGSFNVRDLPGVGHTMAYKLKTMGVHTCTELQNILMPVLQREFGKKTGEMLFNLCRGIDSSKLNLEHVRKSVSAEVNYGIRFEDSSEAVDFLKRLSEEVCGRLKKVNMRGRCVTLKLMVRAKDAPRETAKFMGHGVCDHFTRSKNLISSVNEISIIAKEVLALWNQLQQTPADIRGVGIQISRLEPTKNKSGSGDLKSFMSKAKSRSDADVKDTGTRSKEVAMKICEKASNSKGINAFHVPKQPSSIGIDESVLSELPEDIRNEIFANRKDSSDGSTSKVPLKPKSLSDFLVPKGHSSKVKESQLATRIENSNPLISVSKIGQDTADNVEDQMPMQEIDESVLAELPDHIRNEIIAERKRESCVRNQQKMPAKIQRKQESYFREVKPIERPNKVQMPAVQEIDLTVLVELPDDIRNEILNAYREGRNEQSEAPVPSSSKATTDQIQNEPSVDEANLSFSQIDPEFLAALPEDMRSDVKQYCSTTKLEKESRTRRAAESKAPIPNRSGNTTNKILPNQKTTRPYKSRVGKNAMNGKKNKNAAAKSSKTSMQNEVFSSSKARRTDEEIEMKRNEQEVVDGNNMSDEDDSRGANNAAIVPKLDEHQEMLKRMVEQFLSLPLNQIKVQLQSWILASDSVNEVDFLSLATFLTALPKKKRIEDLHILLKTMHRCIGKTGNCVWHRIYRKTVDHVQRHMQSEYESNLMLPQIECDIFNCGSIFT